MKYKGTSAERRHRKVDISVHKLCLDESFVDLVAEALREHADYLKKNRDAPGYGSMATENGCFIQWSHCSS